MPVLSIPKVPMSEQSPFKKPTPFVMPMALSDLSPLVAPHPPVVDQVTLLDLDTFGQPKQAIQDESASPRPKMRAYQAHLKSTSPQSNKRHVKLDAQALIVKYQQEHPALVGALPGTLAPEQTRKHNKHHSYPDIEDDENMDWTESNNDDPLDHDASANGFENFGQPCFEELKVLTESPKHKMQVYLMEHHSPHTSLVTDKTTAVA